MRLQDGVRKIQTPEKDQDQSFDPRLIVGSFSRLRDALEYLLGAYNFLLKLVVSSFAGAWIFEPPPFDSGVGRKA